MSKAVAPIPPSIIPYPLSYHKSELACLVVGVALLALAFILKSQNLIPHSGFIGLVSGGCGLSVISLIILAKRYYEKYHFKKDDIKMVNTAHMFIIYGRKKDSNDAEIDLKDLISKNQEKSFEDNLDSVVRDFSRNGLFKCGFAYKKTAQQAEADTTYFYSKTVEGQRAEILYALRAIRNGNAKIIKLHIDKVQAYQKALSH